MATFTLWLTIARGGSFLSSGMSSPAAWAGPAAAANRTNAGKAYRIATSGLRTRVGRTAPIIRRALGRTRLLVGGVVTDGLRRGTPRDGRPGACGVTRWSG